MTITATDLDVRAMSLDELADAYSDAGDSMAKAIRTECARRDRAEQAARKREAIRSEWHDFAYQDYLAAEAECRGELVSREGVQAGVRDGFQLWTGPRAIAEKYATQELLDWWLQHPRITIGDYERQRAAAERTAREDTTTEEAGNGDRVGTDGRDGLDGDDAGAVRDGRGTGAGQPVRACRDDGQGEAGPAAGSVQPAAVTGEGVTMETTKDGAEAVTETEAKAPAAPAVTLNGAEALNETERFLKRFAVFPSSHAAVAVTLWAAHTHAFQAFDVTPRLALLGEESRCGKTRVMDLLNSLVARPEFLADLTGPTLFTMIADEPTILVDETDEFFGRGGKGGNRQVRTILNVGYRRGARVPRMNKGAVEKHPVYAPAAFAGIGKLPETLQSRCVVIPMRRRREGEACDRYIPRYHAPLGLAVGAALGSWTASVGAELATAEPELPDGVEDRAAELWWTLLAVADAAGSDWPARAREACVALVRGDSAGEDTQPPAVQLLADMAAVWPVGADRMPTAVLVPALLALQGSPWAGMWTPMTAPREIAALLEPRGIKPVKVRVPVPGEDGKTRPLQGFTRCAECGSFAHTAEVHAGQGAALAAV